MGTRGLLRKPGTKQPANGLRRRPVRLAFLTLAAVAGLASSASAGTGLLGGATGAVGGLVDTTLGTVATAVTPVGGTVGRLTETVAGLQPVEKASDAVRDTTGGTTCSTFDVLEATRRTRPGCEQTVTDPPPAADDNRASKTAGGASGGVADPGVPPVPAPRPIANEPPPAKADVAGPAKGGLRAAAQFPIVFLLGGVAGVLGLVLLRRRDAARAEAVERMKTELLSNISHELRTPLTPVRGYAEMLRTRDLPPERVHEFATAIIDAAEQLEGVVNVLVSYAAIEGGRFELRRGPKDVAAMLGSIAEHWQRRAVSHTITVRVPDGFPPALLDGRLMKLAVDQLVDNAVKFSPGGGPVEIRAAAAGGMLAIAVADRGMGIEPAQLERIFDSFRQGDGSATRRFGGLGIGLSLVDRIARVHGGELQVASEPGRGSVFTIAVPLRRPSDARIVTRPTLRQRVGVTG